MTRKNVTDEQYGHLARRVNELVRRVDEGTIPFDETMNSLQVLIEERFVDPKTGVVGAERQTFKVSVDYAMSLEEMITAGMYDWVNGGITNDHFPVTGNGQKEVEITLFHFSRRIFSNGVIIEMEEAGFRPARIEELLALGAEHKELYKQFPVAALGSSWKKPGYGDRSVVSLSCRHDAAAAESALNLQFFEHGWGETWRFAAVRK